jgi:hypothetical protein
MTRAAPAKAKKAKANPMLEAVLAGLCQSVERQCLSEQVGIVLAELARGGIMTPVDERHAYQVAAVRKVGEVLAAQLRALEDADKKAEEDMRRSESEVRAFNEEQARAGAERSAAATESLAARRRLADRSRVLLDALGAAKDAEASEERSKAAAHDAEGEKAKIDSMWQESLHELQLHEAGPRSKPCKTLLQLAKKVAVDDSLSAALAGVAAHSPEERGTFDKLALEQFERHVEQYLAPLVATIEAAAPGIEACKAAAEKAHVEEKRLRVAQMEAASDYRQAVIAEKDIVANISEFDARTSALERQGAMFTQAMENSRQEKEAFQSWPMACFETLKERTSKRAEEPAAVEGPAPAASNANEPAQKIGNETEPAHALQALGGQ